MAIRYSGDVEIRIRWERRRRLYIAVVATPRTRWRVSFEGEPEASSKDYDRMAIALLRAAEKSFKKRDLSLPAEKKRGAFQIRRVFQAPCPLRCPH